jgi:hypothetical protein
VPNISKICANMRITKLNNTFICTF